MKVYKDQRNLKHSGIRLLCIFLVLSFGLQACKSAGTQPAASEPSLTSTRMPGTEATQYGQLTGTRIPETTTAQASRGSSPASPASIITPVPGSLIAGTPGAEWKLIWSDEFDGPAGSSPDPAKWQFDIGGKGWGNKEWEYYTDKPENAQLDGNGNLIINALPIEAGAGGNLECWYGACHFTSARMLTEDKFSFTYGWIEARIQLPFGKGIWPAFWMLGENIKQVGWPECGEVDIMENNGHELSTIHRAVHGPGYDDLPNRSSAYLLPYGQKFTDAFHVFALEWEPEALQWYVDGNLFATLNKNELPEGTTWVFDHPYFILLDLAVGGNYTGYPDFTTRFPQVMKTDYVRVYQHD